MNEGSPSGFLSWPWLRCRWRAIQALLLSFMVLDSEKSIKSNLNSIDCKNKTKKSGQMIANKHAKVDCQKNTPVPRAHTLHSQTPWLTPLLWQPISSQIFHSHTLCRRSSFDPSRNLHGILFLISSYVSLIHQNMIILKISV